MKKIFILFIVLFTTISQAQMRNSMQRQRQMNQTTQKPPDPDFKIEKYVGIVIYDIKKAAKKSKVKLSSDTGKTFSKTLSEYNKRISDIKRINSFLLKNTKNMIDNFQKTAMKTGDFSNQQKVAKEMNENLKPLSETLKKEDLAFDKKLKSLLSAKQYKKWIKYNRKLYKIFPKE
ncbi:hypothetical protein [Polaribacter septentrionalilitoris]|uniref:hypothetical protein n=1 Tax=Polaribacter septentrionalilitoris TaxID=2494657 RepID=UPI00135C4826|nr:hypothetical protein [Polaribacter septentrionalilitoris]